MLFRLIVIISVFSTVWSKMFARAIRPTMSYQSQRGFKIAVLGASGGIGQPLSLLLKLDSRVTELNLFDVVRTHGVAADISHCNSKAKVAGFVGMEEAHKALEGASVVVIPAGVPRKPGMTRDDLFNTNASIVKGLAEACATACPKAMFLVIANPVNSTVPIFAETLKKKGVYDPRRLFGVTTLDVVRANTFVSENQKFDVNTTKVTVIGGHAGTTILPLLSQVPGAKFTDADVAALTHRIQFGGDEVVKAKDGSGSATLSMAYAGQVFTSRLLAAMAGEKNVVECTFVENNLTAAPFFSTPVRLGLNGVEEVLSFGKLSAFEQKGLDAMLPDLIAQAKKGVDFVKNSA
jgi:malate dehydrogenase